MTKKQKMILAILLVISMPILVGVTCNDNYCTRSCYAKHENCLVNNGDKLQCNVALDMCVSECEVPCQ